MGERRRKVHKSRHLQRSINNHDANLYTTGASIEIQSINDCGPGYSKLCKEGGIQLHRVSGIYQAVQEMKYFLDLGKTYKVFRQVPNYHLGVISVCAE